MPCASRNLVVVSALVVAALTAQRPSVAHGAELSAAQIAEKNVAARSTQSSKALRSTRDVVFATSINGLFG